MVSSRQVAGTFASTACRSASRFCPDAAGVKVTEMPKYCRERVERAAILNLVLVKGVVADYHHLDKRRIRERVSGDACNVHVVRRAAGWVDHCATVPCRLPGRNSRLVGGSV